MAQATTSSILRATRTSNLLQQPPQLVNPQARSRFRHIASRPGRLAAFPPGRCTVQFNRSYATEQRSHDNNNDKRDERPDFKGQLWRSTAERAQRENEQQERFARLRRLNSGQASNILGNSAVLLVACTAFYYLGTLAASPSSRESSTLPLTQATPPDHDTSSSNLQAAWTDLRALLGPDNVSTSPSDTSTHAGSSWSSYPDTPSDVPFAVVRPASTADVSTIMKICHKRRIPAVPYSGGTSLEGHFASTRGGICIDFSRMDQILALHPHDMDAVVQPALGWEALNDELAEHGLFFPPDPGPGAMIGGMVATGCSGTNAYRHGTMRDWVVGLTAVLADGTVIRTRQRPRKSSAGYDLTRLLVGSEGTLALVTEATIKLAPAPQNPRVAVAAFPTVHAAADCVGRLVRAGVPIAAVELLDDNQMRFINAAGGTSSKWPELPTLFFKFAGTPSTVKEAIGLVQQTARSTKSSSFTFARSEAEAAELWSARKEALWSVMAQAPPVDPGREAETKTHVWTTDVAVPISCLPDIVERTKEDMTASGLTGSIVGHVGDGNFHAILLYDAASRGTAEGVVHRMVERALEMEGTCTGEHGVGLVKRDYLEKELGGPEAVDAMRAIKRAWDPLCLLNCDKVVRAGAGR